MNLNLKVAVVGCGALGSYYGAKLCRLGCQTHFLLRSDYAHVRRHGVWIRSDQGDLRLRPRCARTPEEIGPADLVVIGLKTTANDELPRLLPPLIETHTVVLTLQNGLGNEEAIASLVPAGQIMGGLCFVCLNRIRPGVIQHLAHGMIVLGEYAGWPAPRTHDMAGLFRRSGVPCKVADNLALAHWEKLVWNIPFNGLGVAGAAGLPAMEDASHPIIRTGACLTTEALLAHPGWARLVRDLMLEVIAGAGRVGNQLPGDLADRMLEKTLLMGPYKPSTVCDFEMGRPLELDALFRMPLARAQSAGSPMPILERLCRVLETLESRQTSLHNASGPLPPGAPQRQGQDGD